MSSHCGIVQCRKIILQLNLEIPAKKRLFTSSAMGTIKQSRGLLLNRYCSSSLCPFSAAMWMGVFPFYKIREIQVYILILLNTHFRIQRLFIMCVVCSVCMYCACVCVYVRAYYVQCVCTHVCTRMSMHAQ